MSVLFSFFLLGLIIGSFLNVLVYRLKDAETLLGRSFCRHCEHQIRWYDNIPLVSFVLLNGRCRDCREKISWQYPALELITGVCFSLVGYYFSPTDVGSALYCLWLLGMISLFLTIAAYDVKYMEIPVTLLFIGGIWSVVFWGIDLWENGWDLFGFAAQSGFGGIAVGLFFFALVFVSHETWMGWGDVWLGALAGAVVGLSSTLFLLTLSFGTGACVGIGALLFQKKHLKTKIPFAPYLVLGTLLTLFLPLVFPPLSLILF